MRLPRPAWVFLSGVVLSASGLLAYQLWAWDGAPGIPAALFALLLALAVAAQQFPLMLTPRYQLNVAPAVYFAALLLAGWPGATALAATSQLLGGFLLTLRRDRATGRRRRGPAGVLFNAGQMTLATGIAGLVYRGLMPGHEGVPLDHPANLWALPAAAAALHLVSGGLVAVMAGFQRGERPGAVWRAGWRDEALESAGLALLGLTMALLAAHYPWAPLLLVPTVAVLHLAVGRTVRSLEARRAAEASLRASEERFRALVQRAADIITVFDRAGRVGYVSPAVTRILGLRPEELVGTRGRAVTIHPDDRARAAAAARAVGAESGAVVATELRLAGRDGRWRHFEVRATNLRDEPSVRGLVVNARDITERKVFEARLQHQAFHDGLTDLPNRALFRDRLAHALARAGRRGETLAVLFVDLDHFKVVNDSLGHAAGDMLLLQVAARLRGCARSEDTVARLGGDEFAILLEGLASADEAARLAERLARALAVPLAVAGQELFVTASVGIAHSSPEHDAPGALLRDADTALYRAKQRGRARHEVFDPAMNAAARERLALETDLRRAIGPEACAGFALQYQPIVDLATGRVAGLEALLRWRHLRRGPVAPAEFIPLAEETGLIIPLGRWVLRAACRQAVAWRRACGGAPPPRVSVNLSPRQFLQPELVAEVAATLAETALPAQVLTLEITETVLMTEAAAAAETLRALRALGVGVAIDDFGTGYSSLAYLKRFPADTLKIDRAFVAGLAPSSPDEALVAAMVAMAHALGMRVTAEGVETGAQAARLRALGCEEAQGYHFARPLDADAATAFLAGEGRVGALTR